MHIYPQHGEVKKFFEQYEHKVACFNSLVQENQKLFDLDWDLSGFQIAIIEQLASCMQFTENSFFNDCMVFKDICSVFEGKVFIIEEPKEFVPVKRTQTMLNLFDGQLLSIMENHAKVRIGGKREWIFELRIEERRHFKPENLRYRNLRTDADNPLKFVLYKT